MKLFLKITPNARQSECLGWEDDPRAGRVLRLRIAAPPVEGKANQTIIQFLSKYLAIPKSQIDLIKGDTSRIKVVEIPDNTLIPTISRRS